MRAAALVLLALLLALALAPHGAWRAVAPPAWAETDTSGGAAEAEAPPDYGMWQVVAGVADKMLANPSTSSVVLEQWRKRLVDWRAKFQVARNANKSRIAILQAQIDALGPPPEKGATEAPDITSRRDKLEAQMSELKAPGITADEAYSRADGLIQQIDTTIRQRQAEALMQLWPAPVNPAHWPAALTTVAASGQGVWDEFRDALDSPSLRSQLRSNLPLILGYLLFAVLLLARGRRWVTALVRRVANRRDGRWRGAWALVQSLGQIAGPLAGLALLGAAIRATGIVGPLGGTLVAALMNAGFLIIVARWLSAQIFPAGNTADVPFNLPPERQAEGRLHVTALGVLLGLEVLRKQVLVPPSDIDAHAAMAVLAFPLLVLAGIAMFRLGRLLQAHARDGADQEGPSSYRDWIAGVVGRAALVLGVAAPVLAAIGYVPAAVGVLYPAAVSLGLLAMVMIAQRLIGEVYALTFRNDSRGADALVPVLAGFVLMFLSLPLFALIWGARVSDLVELWTRFSQGFAFGGTHISPGNFVTFAVAFAVGFMVTRVIQRALRTSLLPRTRLDRGGQNAIVAGTGYLGIFLAAVIAITAAGIDLSGLALVASALTVGIGFGLQNIVSNFVSGIILLIERPISEGDWIEVNGQHGTVREISVRSTRIQTFDRSERIIPNTDLISGTVTNYTRGNTIGRLIVPVGVSYATDTHLVEKILLEIAREQPIALVKPAPYVVFSGIGSESFNFELRLYLSDINYILDVQTAVLHEIVRRFREENIEMPYSTRDIWLRTPVDVVTGKGADPDEGAAAPVSMPSDVPPEAPQQKDKT